MLADDVTGIVAGPGGRPVVLPAFPWSRLWANAVDALRARSRIGARVRPDIEKYLIRTDRFRSAPLAVGAGYFLTGHNRDTIDFERLRTGDALERILRFTYRKRFLHGLGLGPGALPGPHRAGPADAGDPGEETCAPVPGRSAGGSDRARPHASAPGRSRRRRGRSHWLRRRPAPPSGSRSAPSAATPDRGRRGRATLEQEAGARPMRRPEP